MPLSAARSALFERLKKLIKKHTFADTDLLELIAGSIESSPTLATAYALHARDILAEALTEIEYNEIIGEVYRRTFFDTETAERYGTLYIAEQDHYVEQFVQYLETRYDLDSRGHTNVFPISQIAS